MTDDGLLYRGTFNATPLQISQALRAYTKRYADEVGSYRMRLVPDGEDILVEGIPDEYFDETIEDPIFINSYGVVSIQPAGNQPSEMSEIIIFSAGPRLHGFWSAFMEYLQTQFLEVLPEPEPPEVDESNADSINPWERIPDHGWDRIALEMWWQGKTNSTIAKKVHVVPRRVTNRICELRDIHGADIVPYRKKPKSNPSNPNS